MENIVENIIKFLISDGLNNFATTLMPFILAIFGWRINLKFEQAKRREERLRNMEALLHEDRIDAYNTILEPFILILSGDENFKNTPQYEKYKDMEDLDKQETRYTFATKLVRSVDYYRANQKLRIFGSDIVVEKLNHLLDIFSKSTKKSCIEIQDINKILCLFGEFMLEIRRSVGNEDTKLSPDEIVNWPYL